MPSRRLIPAKSVKPPNYGGAEALYAETGHLDPSAPGIDPGPGMTAQAENPAGTAF